MNYQELAEQANQDEQRYYSEVDQAAREFAALDGKKNVVRIKEEDVYNRVNQITEYGASCLGDDKVNWSKGFHTPKGTWFVLLKSKTSK